MVKNVSPQQTMKIKSVPKKRDFLAIFVKQLFYLSPIVTNHHEPILHTYPRAIAGTHFMCDMKV